MWFRSIFTAITDPAEAAAAINAAARMALANDGHLDVLAVGIERSQIGYADIGAGTMLSEMSPGRAEGDTKAIETAARAALAEQDPALRWNLETAVAELGGLTAVVGNAARFADLVVQAPPYGKGRRFDAETVVEAALFEGHAPVLIVPAGADLTHLANPRAIVLAWNHSAAALNAAKHALPLLQAADKVDVTVVDPAAADPEQPEPGALLCKFLVRHGVNAAVTVLARNQPTIAEVLTRHALDLSADMMVMGAYSHSRLREAILGGATRSMLEHCKIPVLMAH